MSRSASQYSEFSAAPMTILILGGAGFIGRHTAAALIGMGHRVIIGTRHPRRRDRRLSGRLAGCERRAVHLERLLTESDWARLLVDVDAVINCVGILRPRGRATYDRVHRAAPTALARACHTHGLRLVHVSALGLAAGRSGFLRSKRRGEDGVLSVPSDAVVARPSLLDGDGGFGARWIRRVANWPVHPYPANAAGRLAALDVGDLGQCLAVLALSRGGERVVELGGPGCTTIAQLLTSLRTRSGNALRIPVPGALVRLAAHVCDLLHVTPLSFGHYELLQHDNVPVVNAAQRLLGCKPRAVGKPPIDSTAGVPTPAARFPATKSPRAAVRVAR